MSQPEPGACGDPGCYVLHADPNNPIHPPDYMAPGTAALSADDPVTVYRGALEVATAMRRSPNNPCFAGGEVIGGTFAAPDGVVIFIKRPDGRVLSVVGTVRDV